MKVLSQFGFISLSIGAMVFLNLDNEVNAIICPRQCKGLLNNGICEAECNLAECSYDGGDCVSRELYELYGYYEYTNNDTLPNPTNVTQNLEEIQLSAVTASEVDTTQYNIEIVFVGSMESSIKSAFLKAKAKWESIIKNDIPNTFLYRRGSKCWESFTSSSQDKVVDDLMVFAQVTKLDGPGRILGQSGPCYVSNNPQTYSRVGLMQFDEDDMKNMVRDGTIDSVILHEMGHVIGIGTLWNSYNLIQQPRGSDKNAYYLGSGGTEGQKAIQGIGKPIIETNGGQGTSYSHWDEDTYDNELMTGYVNGNQKLSLLTILSLKDMGFVVDQTKAEQFLISNTRNPSSSSSSSSSLRGFESEKKPKYHLGDDIIHKPFTIVQADPY